MNRVMYGTCHALHTAYHGLQHVLVGCAYHVYQATHPAYTMYHTTWYEEISKHLAAGPAGPRVQGGAGGCAGAVAGPLGVRDVGGGGGEYCTSCSNGSGNGSGDGSGDGNGHGNGNGNGNVWYGMLEYGIVWHNLV